MKKALEIGGVLASVALIAFGIAAIVMGIDGVDTVEENLAQERIVGTPDMTPAAIQEEVREAGIADIGLDLPDCDVADEEIDTGSDARCFAEYLRIHALEATGGFAYAQMGRFEAKPDTPQSELAEGGGTDNEQFAVVDEESGFPAANDARDIWVTETALSTALNASYMADRISVFGIVVGIALLLTGIGFGVLVATGAIRDPHAILRRRRRSEPGAPASG